MRNGLVQLSDYLLKKKSILGINDENFDSWMENGTIEQGGKNTIEQGVNILSFRYRGVITIERIQDKNAIWFIAMIGAWLADHSEDRNTYNLEDPEIEIIKLDEKEIDIELTVDFVDEMYLSEADDGPIDWDGKSWIIDGYELDVAESAQVKGESK